jgi:predicted HicB family RNase H-like nuclease
MGNLEYKGFLGTLNYSQDDESFHGKILGIVETHQYLYDGKDLERAEQSFHVSVDEYLASCALTKLYSDDPPVLTPKRERPGRPPGLKPWFPW